MDKFKLLRDGQIVGYERIDGDTIERSYDNQVWLRDLVIPNDTKRAFVKFGKKTLAEVYED